MGYVFTVDSIGVHLGWEFQGEVRKESQGRRLFLRTETSGYTAGNRRIKSREMKRMENEEGNNLHLQH